MKKIIHASCLLLALLSIGCPAREQPSTTSAQQGSLNWLGALPKKLSRQDLLNRQIDFTVRVRKQLAATRQSDIFKFQCRKPEAIGPVPMMSAVEEYLDHLEEHEWDGAIVQRLLTAAAKGNWLARLQVLAVLSEESSTLEDRYRAQQLAEWLFRKNVGGLYTLMGSALASSGYWSDAPNVAITVFDVYAALHDGYPSQYIVGKELLDDADPRKVEIGRRMQACALDSLGAYRRIFTGEAKKNSDARHQQAIEATYTSLHKAVLADDVDTARQLLASGEIQVDAKTVNGQTALDFAVSRDRINPAMVRLLIEHGANIVQHGAVDKTLSPYEQYDLISTVARKRLVNMDVIELLLKAGANPFQTSERESLFRTAFYEAFDLYAHGEPELLERFLATGLLDKTSESAGEYLEQSASSVAVFKRLKQYGIEPQEEHPILVSLAVDGNRDSDEELKERLQLVGDLLQQYPAMRKTQGPEALRRAVSSCQFRPAIYLLEQRIPLSSTEGAELLSALVKECDSSRRSGRTVDNNLREIFLRKLAGIQPDLNVLVRGCPAWTTEYDCSFPDDEQLGRLLLELGADPFVFHERQENSPLISLIQTCRTGMWNLVFAHGPRKIEAQELAGLSKALGVTDVSLWEGLHCPPEFLPQAAAKLRSFGAEMRN